MKRRIIEINEKKCSGCGLCVSACHEGAIELVDGKAKLVRDDYCDGLGDCLPSCPEGAISFVEREASPYDENAVKARKEAHAHSCPGHQAMSFSRKEESVDVKLESCLAQWPCQIKLVPVNAPYFDGADLLIAATCSAFSYANVHQEYMKGRITIVGCPKLDGVDYSIKLGEIIKANDIRSVTVLRMEVPCCGGIEYASEKAIRESGKEIPFNVVTISTDGKIL